MIWMFSVGEKIIYGENGVCTVESHRWPEPRLTASFIITFARLSAAELILRRWIPGHICAP